MILGISGKKSAGKNTIGNWLTGLWMQQYDIIEYSYVDSNGDLIVPLAYDGQVEDRKLDVTRETPFLKDFVYPYVRQFSFADPLKKFCIKVLGLTHEQCYGSDNDKNTLTKVPWANIPLEIIKKRKKKDISGFLTAREVLEIVGTDIMRTLIPTCWCDALMRDIAEQNSEFSIITDVRFPEEIAAIRAAGGKVVRLTRNKFNSDAAAEIALDNFTDFDEVIDNSDMTIEQQNKAIFDILVGWGWIDFEIECK